MHIVDMVLWEVILCSIDSSELTMTRKMAFPASFTVDLVIANMMTIKEFHVGKSEIVSVKRLFSVSVLTEEGN